ncbi:hypothetical protein SEMRO_1980_G309120.1 [Seminavis robusta]|uniref:Uncharacterized protein n=1 Tax=Seminavis robusta TaxID=568900 RepID=A0A9N8EUE3_9STRA|nr:hypothetical protein SEMRO_1980_G309120.1 [Seminavis robusta]|eukprot:Sro1980_g309120.1 n/a (326) ;mRNA; f:1651-3007
MPTTRKLRSKVLPDDLDAEFGGTCNDPYSSNWVVGALYGRGCPNPEPDDGTTLPEDTYEFVAEEDVNQKQRSHTRKIKSSPATKKKKPHKPIPDNTMSSNNVLGSPIKLLRAQLSNADERDDDLEVVFDIDLENEENHGDYLVTMSTEERVKKMQASAIVVVRPNVAPEAVKDFSATFTKDCISIDGPAADHEFLAAASGKDGWLTKLDKTKTRFEATKLLTTLTSLVTKLKKKKRPKTTHISVKSLGITVSNEYFSPGVAKHVLKLIPLPYKVTRKGKNGASEEVTRVILVWRAYIVGTLGEVEADDAQTGVDDLLNEMLALQG